MTTKNLERQGGFESPVTIDGFVLRFVWAGDLCQLRGRPVGSNARHLRTNEWRRRWSAEQVLEWVEYVKEIN